MGDHFYAKESLKSLGKLAELKGDLFTSFLTFDQKVFADGALSVKIKELIAIGAGASLPAVPTVSTAM